MAFAVHMEKRQVHIGNSLLFFLEKFVISARFVKQIL